jgi:translation elongation factor EF-G
MTSGPLIGFPVVDVAVALVDGKPITTSTPRRSPSKSHRAPAFAKR